MAKPERTGTCSRSVWLNAREQTINREPGLGGRDEFVPRSVADSLAEALDCILGLVDGGIDHHRSIGQACGKEPCIACLVESVARDELAAYPRQETTP